MGIVACAASTMQPALNKYKAFVKENRRCRAGLVVRCHFREGCQLSVLAACTLGWAERG